MSLKKFNIYIMKLLNIFSGMFNKFKSIDKKILPSRGLFYKDDFNLKIKKASIEDIKEYESGFNKDLGIIIYKIKKIVEKNLVFSSGYKFNDLKSIDVIFIFLEIVKYTKGKPIKIIYNNEETSKEETVEFNSSNFNYYELEKECMDCYNSINREFAISGYHYTLPSIGVENCLTQFLIMKSSEPDSKKYNDYNYSFTYFLGHKDFISFAEIDNLIQIFNYDLDELEKLKIEEILKVFVPMQRYTLIKNGKVIEINSKIDLENIWK